VNKNSDQAETAAETDRNPAKAHSFASLATFLQMLVASLTRERSKVTEFLSF
jgi:hypothetical protein